MSTYCTVAAGHPLHGPYHDHEYGFPVGSEDALFERLILEINQAGLSWELMLRKRQNFRRAYSAFDVDAVAAYGSPDRDRLLADPGIVRNRLKVDAAIFNATQIVQMRQDFGSFAGWLNHHHRVHPGDREAWLKLFKRTFRFTGGEIVGEFLMSTGYLPGAHETSCPVHARILESMPPWMTTADQSPCS